MTRALVLGLARSGRAATLALRRRGVEVIAHDTSLEVDATDLEATGARVVLGEEDSAFLDGVDLVVKSPGVPGRSPLVTGARERAIAVISEIELGAQLLPNPIVGVTGTNGKTTTTALLGAVFAAANMPVEVAGNIGRPLTSLVDEAAADAWIVCELSSFQLEDVETLRPRIAVLLNLEPDHIDRHPGLRSDVKLITSIPGVGNTTAAKVLAYLGDVRRFKNGKALAAFIGVTPRLKLSGKSVHGRSVISRSGHAGLRHCLYMPAMVALKHNPLVSVFGIRLQSTGLAPKAVIAACMPYGRFFGPHDFDFVVLVGRRRRVGGVAGGGLLHAEPLVVVVHRDREHALGVVLADHIVVENGADLHRRGHAVARLDQARLVLLADDVHAELDAFIADEYGRAGDELADLVLALAAKGAIKGVFRIGSAHLAHLSFQYPLTEKSWQIRPQRSALRTFCK
jgi:hypothetical protein